MIKRIRSICLFLATFGSIGSYLGSFLIPSCMGVLWSVVLQQYNDLNVSFFAFSERFLFFLIIAIVWIGLLDAQEEQKHSIILHKIVGAAVCFSGNIVQLPLFILVGGFFLYHILTFICERFFVYVGEHKGLTFLARLLFLEFCIGLSISLIFHLIVVCI